MGEGNTSAVTLQMEERVVVAKLEFESPTRSFKDRGAAVLVAAAVEAAATHVVADSSGNAGVAIATYAAHAGVGCEVFVAAATDPTKVERMRATGADVHAVAGTREEVAAAAAAHVEATGAFYASHVWNPWFFEGTKRFVYELLEQVGHAPSTLVLPAGNGTLVLGAWRALRELDTSSRIVAVQAEACAPIATAFSSSAQHVEPVVNQGTIAAGIAIAAPVRGDEILEAVRATGGTCVTVSDDDLRAAVEALRGHGFDVEPTAAAPFAALPLIDGDDVVIPIAAGRRSG